MHTKVQLKSFAKLNLALNIVGTNKEYHTIDSVVTSINLYDFIDLKTRQDDTVIVNMRGIGSAFISAKDNNAFRAAKLFVQTFQTQGATIDIYKNIPVGAGLGGSSADCAGVLNAMARAYGVEDKKKLKELADSLGSDTGYMLHGGLARLKGRGEKVQNLYMKGKLYFLLLFPKGSVNTGKCYKKYDSLPPQPLTDIDKLTIYLKNKQLKEGAALMYNSLQAPAMAINKHILPALHALRQTSAATALVTGSGSCVYGVFFSYAACRQAQRECSAFKNKIVIPVKQGFQFIE